MRRKLILRFIAAYVLIAVAAQALSSSVWILLQGAGILKFDETVSFWELLRHLLAGMGQAVMAVVFPGMDLGSLAGSLVTAGVLAAGAAIFAGGPARQYEGLCDRAELLAPGDTAAAGSSTMEHKLDAIAKRMQTMEGEARACRSSCQQAAVLLEEVRAQLEVLVEAGILAEGSAEAELIQDAVRKISMADARING